MNSSTVQFLVAGALIAAWAWMLGRPLLTNLLRRSRRDSISHFRYQQAMLAGPGEPSLRRRWSWEGRPAPIAAWRAQRLESKRLQLMLGFAFADFVALLLAIALRGLFIRLLLLMTVCFVAHLVFATYVGSVQLRQIEEQARRRRAQLDRDLDERRRPLPGITRSETERSGSQVDEVADAAAPDIRFPPLNIDEGEAERSGAPATIDPAATHPEVQGEPDLDIEDGAGEDPDRGLGSSDRARFTSAPVGRRRPQKVHPVYIDAVPDEPDGDRRAVND